MKFPQEVFECKRIDMIEQCMQEVLDKAEEPSQEPQSENAFNEEWLEFMQEVDIQTQEHEDVEKIEVMLSIPISAEQPRAKPSVEEPPHLVLKQLRETLKYAFLGPDNTLPVIILALLNQEQEEKLLQVLKKCKAALG